MLKLSRSSHTAVKDEEDVDHTYDTEGGSGDEAGGTDELNRVHVPRIPCPFTQQQWDSIKEQFDPLHNDACIHQWCECIGSLLIFTSYYL